MRMRGVAARTIGSQRGGSVASGPRGRNKRSDGRRGSVRIYLAGPMRGYPEFNRPAFTEGAALLRSAGHEVFSPAEYDQFNGFDWTGHDGDLSAAERDGFSLREALGADLAWICAHAEAMVVLPGWQASKGATAEAATALALNAPVWELACFLLHGTDAPAITSAAPREGTA